MAVALNPYPAYVDSGVPELRGVPEHWQVVRLRRVLRQVTVRNRPDLPLLSVVREKGVILRDMTSSDENHNYIPDDLTNYKVVRTGQFAMNKMKAWQGSYGVSRLDGIVSPAYFVFDVCGIDGTFFHTAIRSKAYVPFFGRASDGVRIGQWDLSQTRMKEIPFFIPPVAEQAAIVRYLDYMDRRIRHSIRVKQQLITLLEEKRQAIVRRAVMCGLDRSVRLSSSGVPWLGEVPEHWQVRKLHSLFRRHGSGTTPAGDTYYGGGIPWVMTGDLSDGALLTTKRTVTQQALDQVSALRLFPSGSLIVAMYGATIGKTGVLAMDACTNQACCVLAEPKPHANPEYLQAVVNLARRHLIEQSYGGGQPNINAEIVRSLRVPLPPRPEQDKIVEAIHHASEQSAIDRTLREIDLLREYQTRLVAEVVTGKLDAREAAANLPDGSEPLEHEGLQSEGAETDELADQEAALEEVEV